MEWLLHMAGDDQWFPVAARQRAHQVAVHPSDELDHPGKAWIGSTSMSSANLRLRAKRVLHTRQM